MTLSTSVNWGQRLRRAQSWVAEVSAETQANERSKEEKLNYFFEIKMLVGPYP